MATAKQKRVRAEIAELERQEKDALEDLAISIANLEALDEELDDARNQRDRLKSRKEKGLKYDIERLTELNEHVRQGRVKVASIRHRLARRRGRLNTIRHRVKRRRRQLRNLRQPRIIVLDLDFRPMALQVPNPDKVIGHYTAGPRDLSTKDAIRLCHLYHQAHLAQGWSGEAYALNFTVDGDILVLRPAKWVGAHTLGENTGSYGIVCHGTTGDKPNGAQKRAMRWWAKNGHRALMGPGQTTVRPADLDWFGHNDFNATGCPGSFKPTYLAKGRE